MHVYALVCLVLYQGTLHHLVLFPTYLWSCKMFSFFLRWEDNIKMHLQEVDGEAWAQLIWLRIGTDGEH
jgi:hypothetical protein